MVAVIHVCRGILRLHAPGRFPAYTQDRRPFGVQSTASLAEQHIPPISSNPRHPTPSAGTCWHRSLLTLNRIAGGLSR